MQDLPLHANFAAAKPGSVDLAADHVHVWAVPLNGDADDSDELLSDGERQRLQRFRFADHQRRYRIGHSALRRILAGYLNRDPKAIEFVQGPRGKPFLVGTGPFFNMSHSGKLALIGVAQAELGLDVEKVRHIESLIQIAERHFSPSEFRSLTALEGEARELAFYRCWTRKEAYIKAVGEGLSMALDTFDVSVCEEPRFLASHDGREDPAAWSMVDVSPAPEFVGAVAIKQPAPQVRCFCLQA